MRGVPNSQQLYLGIIRNIYNDFYDVTLNFDSNFKNTDRTNKTRKAYDAACLQRAREFFRPKASLKDRH